MSNIRLVIADDQEIIRQGLKIILDHQPDMTVLAQAANGDEAVALAASLKPDVMLMDIKMPIRDGIAATREIARVSPTTAVILLTTYDTDGLVFEGVRAGARGYLLKDAGTERLADAIRAVHRGESQLDPQVARKVMDEFRRMTQPGPIATPQPEDNTPFEALTEREAEILGLIAQGMSNKEIAGQLFLTEGTVRNYVSTVLEKLHANDRTQLVIKAARRGIVKL
jgi:DNA-binding NarL/FixJ family response regulator